MPTKDFSSNMSVGGIPDIKVTQKTPVANNPALLGKAAEAGLGLYNQYENYQAEKGLLGTDEDGTTIGGVEVPPGMADADLAKMAQDDSSVSLRKIKKMREQGRVSADGAKLLAANAVQREIAARPSKAREIQAMAGKFFGTFGEGQDLLDATAAEKKQNELTDFIRKKTAEAGLFSLDSSGKVVVTQKDMDEWRLHAYSLQKIDITKKTIEMRLEQGKASVSDVEQYAGAIAHTSVVGLLGKFNAHKEQNNGMIMKPEEMEAIVAQTKIDVYKQIDQMARRRTADGSALITPEQLKGMRASADVYFDEVKTYIKSGSFASIMKDRREGLSNYTAMLGIKAMPLLAMADGVAPGSSKYIMDMLPRLATLTGEQRKVMFANEPHLALLWDETMAAHTATAGINNLMKGYVPDFSLDPASAATTVGLAKVVVRDPNSKTEAPDLREKAFTTLINSAKSKAGVLADIRAANFGDLSPEQEAALANVTSSHIKNLMNAVRGIGNEPYELSFANGQFVLIPGGIHEQQIEIMGGDLPAPSRELKAAVDAANESIKTMSFYEKSPAFADSLNGMSAADWAKSRVEQANAAAQRSVVSADPKAQVRQELYQERLDAYKQAPGPMTENWLKKIGVKSASRAAELDGVLLPEYEGVPGRWYYDPFRDKMVNKDKE